MIHSLWSWAGLSGILPPCAWHSRGCLLLGLRLGATSLQGALLDVVGAGALVEDDPAIVDLDFAVDDLLLGDAALPRALLLLECDKRSPPREFGSGFSCRRTCPCAPPQTCARRRTSWRRPGASQRGPWRLGPGRAVRKSVRSAGCLPVALLLNPLSILRPEPLWVVVLPAAKLLELLEDLEVREVALWRERHRRGLKS